MNAPSSRKSPAIRAALAAFAVLYNAFMPTGWAVAGPSLDPSSLSGVVFCLAGGETMSAPQAADRPQPARPDRLEHCPVCPLPSAQGVAAHGAPLAAPPIRYIRIELLARMAPARTGTVRSAAFFARAPPA